MLYVMRPDSGNKPRMIGPPTHDWVIARRLARRHNGQVYNQQGELVMQAVSVKHDRHVDVVRNISSGEDAS